MSDFNRPNVPALPAFISCKSVQAAAIEAIHAPAGEWALQLQGIEAPVQVSGDWINKHRPQPGWYLIVYPDGYVSAAPAEVIERDYIPAHQWGLPIEQEPKYTVSLRGRLVNRASGREIPADEPVFLLRAQDTIARRVVEHYRDVAEADSFDAGLIDTVGRRAMDFALFSADHPKRMKEPS